jgi:hypothetical protein
VVDERLDHHVGPASEQRTGAGFFGGSHVKYLGGCDFDDWEGFTAKLIRLRGRRPACNRQIAVDSPHYIDISDD